MKISERLSRQVVYGVFVLVSVVSFYGLLVQPTSAQSSTPYVTNIGPTPNSTIGSSQRFVWTHPSGVINTAAIEYQVYLGTSLGQSDLFNKVLPLGSVEVTIPNIPQTGQKVYLRILSKINDSVSYNNFVYTTGGGNSPITILTPAKASYPGGSVPLPSTQTFSWTPVSGATEYWVVLKREEGVKLYDKSTGANTSVTITNIPQDDKVVVLQIWYKAGGKWYASGTVPAKEEGYRTNIDWNQAPDSITFVHPSSSTTIPTSQLFSWNNVNGATEYWVILKKGAVTLYDKTTGTNTQVTINNIPQDGSALTFQIFYKAGGRWYMSNTTPAKEVMYKSGVINQGPGGGGEATTITTITPESSKILGSSQSFSWNSVIGATEYWVALKQGTKTLYDKTAGRNTSVILQNIPEDGSTVTFQVWYKAGGVWFSSAGVPAKQVTYKTYNPGGQTGLPYVDKLTPVPGSTIQSTTKFTWDPVVGNISYLACLSNGSDATTNLCNFGFQIVAEPSVTFTNIPSGRKVSLRIFYIKEGMIRNQNFNYETF